MILDREHHSLIFILPTASLDLHLARMFGEFAAGSHIVHEISGRGLEYLSDEELQCSLM